MARGSAIFCRPYGGRTFLGDLQIPPVPDPRTIAKSGDVILLMFAGITLGLGC